jgi:hypothetical protein
VTQNSNPSEGERRRLRVTYVRHSSSKSVKTSRRQAARLRKMAERTGFKLIELPEDE